MNGDATVTMNSAPARDIWKSEFLTRISHEMRTPLTTIIGYSEVMLSDPKLPASAKQEYMEIIRNAGKRLSEFLDTYLDSEVIQRNRQLLEKRKEDLSLLTHKAIEQVSGAAASKGVVIATECEPGIFVDGGDPDHLVQILENLLLNAVELAPEGGHIGLIVRMHATFIEIRIINKDRGFLSISDKVAGKNFRWIQSPGIEIHHDGLGLAFAKHVVELEGGLLNVQLCEDGLSFTLQFPRSIK